MEMQRLMAQQSSQHISELDSLNRMYFMKQIKIRRELQNIKQRLNEMD